MPEAVLFSWLLRGAGFLLVCFGALIWVIATDVVRYQPLVLTVIVIFLVAAPVCYIIDAVAGLPWWWRIVDLAACLLAGGVPLAFLMRRQTA